MSKDIWTVQLTGCRPDTLSRTPVSVAAGEAAARTLRVETFAVPPFVIEQGDQLTGFSIEIWNDIARRLKVGTTYEKALTPGAAFEALRSRQADLGIAVVFITVERDREFDFSYPVLEAGQQVMVRATGRAVTADNPLKDILRLLFSRTTAIWLGIALVLLLIPAHIVWLLERQHREGIIPTEKYLPGIFHAGYWSASTLLTQAEQMPRQWLARALALFWMFTGVVFVALYTAQLTTTLTVQEIRGAINGPQDLPGKTVGTIAGSVSANYLHLHNARVQEFTEFADLVRALVDGKLDAVLLAAPPLRYYQAHEGKGLEPISKSFRSGM